MGITGLATFVREIGLGEAAVRKYANSKALKTKLVVDGWALLHHVYMGAKIDFISGGQYTQLEQELTQYFTALSKAGFSPYIIFDGVLVGILFLNIYLSLYVVLFLFSSFKKHNALLH